jgi:outer membrane lipoprotein SlyB
MNVKKGLVSNVLIMGALAILTGCAATQTAIEHRNLETSTRLSETVFLNPVADAQKTIYVAVKNTSDEDMDIEPALKASFKSHGYQVVQNPNAAHYLLQANILKVGKMSLAASQSALGGGYGSAIAGAVAGGAAGSLTNSATGVIAGGLAGGVLGLAADSLVKDVNYTVITDIQISEKVGRGIKVNEQFQAHLKNGSSSTSYQTSSNESQYQRYRTRIVSNADKVNLKFPEARLALERGLVKSIRGIF